jgi:hypothetical protein
MNESSTMKKTFKIRQLIFMIVLALSASTGNSRIQVPIDREVAVGSNEDIRQRLKSFSHVLEIKYTEKVQSQIQFLLESKNLSRTLLGRAEMYFPMIDEALAKHDIPSELKFLAVIESGLVPYLSSSAGAAGLWQFMPVTAEMFGLKVKSTYDERKDAHKASEAAAIYLKKLFNIYKDWTLVLAAYNCGDGTLNRAMKKTSSKSYWDIAQHLPQQTQDFVPRFIAAAYLMNFYYLHDLTPDPMPEDYVFTGTLKVKNKIDLEKLAEDYQISPEAMKRLNSVYTKGFIPESEEGEYFLTLPESKIYDYAIANNLLDQITGFSFASLERQKKSQLDAKNTDIAIVNTRPEELPFSKLPAPSQPFSSLNFAVKAIKLDDEGLIKIVMLSKGKSLNDVAIENGVDLNDLIELNKFSDTNVPKLGDQIKVRI